MCWCTRDALMPQPLTNLVEVSLHVVAVKFRAAEDESLVHLVGVDGPQAVFSLQHLHSLTQGLWWSVRIHQITSYINGRAV